MKWATRAEMREIDRRAIEEFGIPAIVLMENAGRGSAAEAERLYRERGLDGPVLVFCGAGNNGGDGFVAARHLANAGLAVQILLCCERSRIDPGREAGIHLAICERMALPIGDLSTPEQVRSVPGRLVAGSLAVDAVFGTGLCEPPREPQATLLRLLDEARLPTVAIDTPSGLDVDTGQPLGVALHADVTATMACPKAGFRGPGAAYVGRLAVVDIGLPAFLVRE